MLLSDNSYPPDIRVEKETSALLEDGHEVHLLCVNNGQQLKNEIVEGVIGVYS